MKYLNFDKHLGAIDQQLDSGTGFFGRQASVSTQEKLGSYER